MKRVACCLPGLLLAVALLPSVAGAQEGPARPPAPPCGPGMPHERGAAPAERAGPGEGPPPFLRGIDLSKAQKDKIAALMQAQAPQLREQHQAVAQAHEALHALGLSSKFDEAKAGALAQTLAQAMAKAALQRARVDQQIVALLSAEQRQWLEQHQQLEQRPLPGPRHAPGQRPPPEPRQPPRPQ